MGLGQILGTDDWDSISETNSLNASPQVWIFQFNYTFKLA